VIQNSKISTSSAALDLAPLAQTNQRFPHRPFDTGLKTSEWPQFSGVPKSANDAAAGSTQASTAAGNVSGQVSSNGTGNNNNAPNGTAVSANVSRRESPTGPNAGGADMSASIASLPPMPSRSVPGTPGAPLNPGNLGGLSSFRKNGPPTAGIAGGQALEGLSASQRGFSNPDLAKAFQKVGPAGFGPLAGGPRVRLCTI
jgi:hypothetical protein